jgi:hypothetical protein
MRKLLATLTILFLFATPIIVEAANCPAEVQAAKDMLKKQSAQADQIQTPRALAGAVSREANAPRSGGESAAPRTDKREANAPRSGGESAAPRIDKREANAPRSGGESAAPRTLVDRESQAPRSGGESAAPRIDKREANAPRVDRESNAPRGQDSAAPRTAASAPQVSKARTLVNEAETACKAGDMTKATQKAKAAMELLK